MELYVLYMLDADIRDIKPAEKINSIYELFELSTSTLLTCEWQKLRKHKCNDYNDGFRKYLRTTLSIGENTIIYDVSNFFPRKIGIRKVLLYKNALELVKVNNKALEAILDRYVTFLEYPHEILSPIPYKLITKILGKDIFAKDKGKTLHVFYPFAILILAEASSDEEFNFLQKNASKIFHTQVRKVSNNICLGHLPPVEKVYVSPNKHLQDLEPLSQAQVNPVIVNKNMLSRAENLFLKCLIGAVFLLCNLKFRLKLAKSSLSLLITQSPRILHRLSKICGSIRGLREYFKIRSKRFEIYRILEDIKIFLRKTPEEEILEDYKYSISKDFINAVLRLKSHYQYLLKSDKNILSLPKGYNSHEDLISTMYNDFLEILKKVRTEYDNLLKELDKIIDEGTKHLQISLAVITFIITFIITLVGILQLLRNLS